MQNFAQTGRLLFAEAEKKEIRETFKATSVSQQQTLATIRDFYRENGYVLDPHTAVGVCAALDHLDREVPMVCLATAHPAKFGNAVQEAIGLPPEMPSSLAGLEKRPTRCEVLDADAGQIKAFIEKNAC
jgi:threonine synthase